jgi:hypothetical protein
MQSAESPSGELLTEDFLRERPFWADKRRYARIRRLQLILGFDGDIAFGSFGIDRNVTFGRDFSGRAQFCAVRGSPLLVNS